MKKAFAPENRSRQIFGLVIFLILLVFFTVLHPMPIMDEDDVIYTVLSRKAIPIPSAWNPSRMMPEVLMPLCGNLAGLLAAFGLGSFIDCQVFVLGLMLSLQITAYVLAFLRLLERRFSLDRFSSVCVSMLFLLLHFVIFRCDYSRNLYMFHAYDACCIFFYTIPALLCCTLVMVFMTEPEEPILIGSESPVRGSLQILILYFAVFSNLFGSILLAAYAACRLLRDLKRTARIKMSAGEFLRRDGVLIGILVLWLFAVLLEAGGGRAGNTVRNAADGSLSFTAGVRQAMAAFSTLLGKTCLYFRLLAVFFLLGGAAACVIRQEGEKNRAFLAAAGTILVVGLISLVFLLLLSAAVNPEYMGRPEATFPVFFTLFLLMLLCCVQMLKRVPKAALLLPVALVFTVTMTNTRFLTFADSNPLFIDGHLAVAVENEIYGQVIEAGERGESEVTVRVPRSWDPVSNWPHDGNIGNPIAQFFLKYGLIDHEITVRVAASDEMNEEFNIHPYIQ